MEVLAGDLLPNSGRPRQKARETSARNIGKPSSEGLGCTDDSPRDPNILNSRIKP